MSEDGKYDRLVDDCGPDSFSARRRHLAHGEVCQACGVPQDPLIMAAERSLTRGDVVPLGPGRNDTPDPTSTTDGGGHFAGLTSTHVKRANA